MPTLRASSSARLLGLTLDAVGDREQHPRPLGRRERPPLPLRLARVLDGVVDVLGPGPQQRRQHGFGGRLDHVNAH
jgi:hypothetical protein